ncbi:hypothetical protein K443DRAFT_294510 [Laccaria amethystina LaAM-08-1]|uniref:Uncharacterized protein n=1 Tax=Laccaria amethystina LaAM-08-1 TaxID=1095629 RepID=A0A0C9XEM6_9AGAR|nr:hypothetical protein K443DRAFT_294510 [Laccaria amethystina LaAM-08-1]
MNKCSYPTPLGAEISPSVYASKLADKCSSPKICTDGLPSLKLKTRQLACRMHASISKVERTDSKINPQCSPASPI